MNHPADDLSLIGHLTELRTRLVYSLIAISAGAILAWNFSDVVFELVRRPILPYLPEGGLVFTAPMDKFMAHLKVSFLSGVIGTCPFWIYQLWAFVAPGLYKNEKRFGLYFMFFGSVLFLSGVAFVYTFVFPAAFKVLLNFGGGVDKAMITINDYLSFFTTTTLVFGLAFELPLVLTMLGLAGVVSAKGLGSVRRYAIVIICIASGFLTPPDPLSLALLAVPLYSLYEISILLVRILAPQSDAGI